MNVNMRRSAQKSTSRTTLAVPPLPPCEWTHCLLFLLCHLCTFLLQHDSLSSPVLMHTHHKPLCQFWIIRRLLRRILSANMEGIIIMIVHKIKKFFSFLKIESVEYMFGNLKYFFFVLKFFKKIIFL